MNSRSFFPDDFPKDIIEKIKKMGNYNHERLYRTSVLQMKFGEKLQKFSGNREIARLFLRNIDVKITQTDLEKFIENEMVYIYEKHFFIDNNDNRCFIGSLKWTHFRIILDFFQKFNLYDRVEFYRVNRELFSEYLPVNTRNSAGYTSDKEFYKLLNIKRYDPSIFTAKAKSILHKTNYPRDNQLGINLKKYVIIFRFPICNRKKKNINVKITTNTICG